MLAPRVTDGVKGGIDAGVANGGGWLSPIISGLSLLPASSADPFMLTWANFSNGGYRYSTDLKVLEMTSPTIPVMPYDASVITPHSAGGLGKRPTINA